MNHRSTVLFFVILFFILTGCYKSNFFEDVDDPGLSRFTSRGYNVTSAYINGEPWVSGFTSLRGAYPCKIYLDTTGQKDSLRISWEGEFSSAGSMNVGSIIISLPVKDGFTGEDFLNWNNRQFPADTTNVTISLNGDPYYGGSTGLSGPGKIYFVRIKGQYSSAGSNGYSLSGLFEGTAGNSIAITKGRFDYGVFPNNNNLP